MCVVFYRILQVHVFFHVYFVQSYSVCSVQVYVNTTRQYCTSVTHVASRSVQNQAGRICHM